MVLPRQDCPLSQVLQLWKSREGLLCCAYDPPPQWAVFLTEDVSCPTLNQAQFHCAAWEKHRPTLLSAGTNEKWSQLSRMLHSVRDRASSTQALDIHMIPGGCSNQGHPHVL